MARYDFRTKSEEALTFYVFDNLRSQDMPEGTSIYYYDNLEDAIKKFGDFPKEWTTAIGCSLQSVHEIDLVHRVNGEPVRVMDFYGIETFSKRTDIHESMNQLEKALSIRYQMVFGIHPRRSVLAPIEDPNYMDSHLKDKVLFISKNRRSTALFASINELYVQGEGWMEPEKFLKAYPNDAYHDPHSPVVEKVNANYMEIEKGWTGQCDMSPVSFKNMMQKTKEYNLSFADKKEPVDQQIAQAEKALKEGPHKGSTRKEIER